MKNGELQQSNSLPVGIVVTSSGRLSVAKMDDFSYNSSPFSSDELIALDEALIRGTRDGRVRFSVLIGNLGDDVVVSAAEFFPKCPEAGIAVLIAVDPVMRNIAIITGAGVAHRVTNSVVNSAINSAITNFKNGELIFGIIAAINAIAISV